MKMILKEKKLINTSDLYNVCSELANTAGNHANMLGVGQNNLLPQGLTWMVSKNRLEFVRDGIGTEVITWPKESGRIDCDRDYLLVDDEGILIKCRAKWFIYNYETKRIMRSDCVKFPYEFSDESYMDSDIEKLEIPIDLEYYKSVIIDETYLDENNHCNNAKYLWMFNELVPLNKKYIQIDYKNQALLNDKVDLYIKKLEKKLTIVGKIEDKISFVTEIGE